MNGWIIALIVAGILVAIGAELAGVWKHGDHKTDTISEMWWNLRERLGPWKGALALVLGGVFLWAFWHLTWQGRGKDDTTPTE